MSIEAINEQLLRAIGVGVALVDMETFELKFQNDTFIDWFGESGQSAKLNDYFPAINTQDVGYALRTGGRHSAETSFKLRRRTMTVALEFNRAIDADENVIVLVCQNITRIKELESMIESYSMMVERNTHELKREKEQVEKLLLNMMPRSAYEEFKTFGVVSPSLFNPVSVLSLDFDGFNSIVANNDVGVVISELNDIYSAFDRIGEQFGCQRIRTNGDSYVAVSGVPDPVADHAQAVASSAIRFLRYLKRRNESHPIKWNARIGISSGPVIGSVVGSQNYIYDVFGESVTQAAECRSTADAMTLVASGDMATALEDKFTLTSNQTVDGDEPGSPVFIQVTERQDS